MKTKIPFGTAVGALVSLFTVMALVVAVAVQRGQQLTKERDFAYAAVKEMQNERDNYKAEAEAETQAHAETLKAYLELQERFREYKRNIASSRSVKGVEGETGKVWRAVWTTAPSTIIGTVPADYSGQLRQPPFRCREIGHGVTECK